MIPFGVPVRRVAFFVCLSVCVFLLVFVVSTVRKPTPDSPPVMDKMALLRQSYALVDPNSAEAETLRTKMRKLKWMNSLSKPEAPTSFYQELARAKQGRDGSSYEPGYMARELQQARRRKKKADDPLPWVSRGPGNVSGRVRSIVVDKKDPSGHTWFLGTAGGGIWRTTDNGQSFSYTSPELTTMSTCALAQSESNPDVLYAGTGLGFYGVLGGAYTGSGIWKSTDHGHSWTQLASTANGQLLRAVNRIIVSPFDENLVLAACVQGGSTGIFRSTDGGQSWTRTWSGSSFANGPVQQLIADPTNFSRIYATVNGDGIIVSNNAGINWIPLTTINHPDNTGRIELAIAPSDPSRLYASVNTNRYGEIYASRDTGQTWQLMSPTGSRVNWFTANGGTGGQGEFDNTIVVNPYNPDEVYVGGVNLYRLDVISPTRYNQVLAAFWIPQPNVPDIHADQHALVVIPKDAQSEHFEIIVGNDGGVGQSLDSGNDWEQLTGMVSTQFYDVDKRPGRQIFAGGMQDNGTWMSTDDPDAATDWQVIGFGDGNELAFHHDNPSLMLISNQYSSYWRSTNGAESFERLNLGQGGPFVSKIAQSKIDPDVVLTFTSGVVHRTEDFGGSWYNIPVQDWTGTSAFDDVKISLADPKTAWLVTGNFGNSGGLWRSADGGLSWTDLSARIPFQVGFPLGIETHPSEAGTAFMHYAGNGSPKIMRTRNYGESWQDITGFVNGSSVNGFPNVATFSVMVIPHQPNTIWAGTEIGLFVSEDDGGSWQLSDNGLPPAAIFDMSTVDDQIIVATHGRGVWTATVDALNQVTKPDYILPPRIDRVGYRPDGKLLVSVRLPSAFDGGALKLSGTTVVELEPNDRAKTLTYALDLDSEGTITLVVSTFRDGQIFESQPRVEEVFIAESVEDAFTTDFETSADTAKFTGTGFSFDSPPSFDNQSLNTEHPYQTDTPYYQILTVPIRLGEDTTMSFDEIAIVETGLPNSTWQDQEFWDYCIVEGSKDGFNWIPVVDGYDASWSSNWNQVYNQGSQVRPELYERRTIDLMTTFKPGDVIFLRFRMLSDPGTVGWGWSIDNLEIGSTKPVPSGRSLLYPWISNNPDFRSTLVMDNHSDIEANLTLTARRANGEQATANLTLPPRGFAATAAADLFPSLGDGAGYTVVMDADVQDITGRWVTNNLVGRGPSPSQGVAVDISASRDDERVGPELTLGYLPINEGLTSAPVIVNTGTAATGVTLFFHDQAGTSLIPEGYRIENLEPMLPFAVPTSTIGNQLDRDVAVTAIADSGELTGVVFVFNELGETAIGNGSADSGASSLLYPWISANATYGTTLVVNNLGDETVTVTLNAVRGDGLTATTTRDIPPQGFLADGAAELFPDLAGGSGLAVTASADGANLQGRWVTLNQAAPSGSSPAQGVAVSLPAPNTDNGRVGTQLSFDYLPLDADQFAAPVLVNTGSGPTNVTLYFYDREGALLHVDYKTLYEMEPGVPFAALTRTWLDGVEGGVYLRAVSSKEAIAGVTFVFNEDGEPAIGNAVAVP